MPTPPSPAPIDESHPTRPLSPYGIGKLAAEGVSRQILEARGIPFTAVRFFNTFGPGQTYTPYVGVITIFVTRLLRGESPVIFGDGEQQRDFVHVDDIVAGTMAAPGRTPGTLQPRHRPRHVAQPAGGDADCAQLAPGQHAGSMPPRTPASCATRSPTSAPPAARSASRRTRSLQQDLDDVIAWVREREVTGVIAGTSSRSAVRCWS